MSNFNFLEKEWPLLAKFGTMSESYLYEDPNASLYKLGLLAEQIVSYMCDINGISVSEENNNQVGRIRALKNKGLIPKEIDEILYALRINRNQAVHSNLDSFDKAALMLELSHKLCVWFQQTYGLEKICAANFELPQKKQEYSQIIKQLESEIESFKEKLSKVELSNKISVEQRRKLSDRNANLMTLSEKEVRFFIDEQLRKAGWEADTNELRYSKGTRPIKGRNIVIAEWPTDSAYSKNGYADYAFFVGEKLIAFMDAKKPEEDVASTIDIQVKDYARNVKAEHGQYVLGNWFGYQVPFLFASNGRQYLEQIRTKSGIWFLDVRNNSNQPYPIKNWFSPNDLEEKLSQNIDAANNTLRNSSEDYMTDPTGLNLRDYQIKAIHAATKAIIEGRKTALLAMATGTGKTRTVLGLIYKMLEAKRFKRILFLVDRVSLGEQAMDSFKNVKLKELLTLDQIYEIKDIDDNEINLETKVSVSTVQGLLRRTILSEEPDLMPGAFDLIIVDEAHRGYVLDREMSDDELLYDSQDDFMSKYKQVIEYFDAVKIALTATPALHTTQIFGEPVFTYSYREAVIDGWLVDHDPPYLLNTDFIKNAVKFKRGEQIAIYDPNTNELLNGAVLQDELDFDVSDFNRQIVLPDHTRKVLQELSQYINPESQEKTLIFAVNDNHADMIVDMLRDIYKEYGVSNEAILKITGKTASGVKKKILQTIKQFKNNQYPNIVVTVDLLTTGIDVPKICNLVFMRKINSRILFEQMLGRATRLCPEINKTHFNIFDAVRVYEDLDDVTGMKSVTVKKDMATLLEELFRQDNKKKQLIKDRIIAKLQRKANNLTDQQKYDIADRTGGKTLKDYARELVQLEIEDFINICNKDYDFLLWVEKQKGKKRGKYYSDKEDSLLETTRGYGDTDKPEDYLESFNLYINEKKDKIQAIKIACTKPSDLTRAQLKELKLLLDKENFNETNLNEATSAVKNEKIVADIISYIRQAVLHTPVRDRIERVKIAFDKLIANNSFNKIQLDLLEKIKTYMMHESILNVETFEAPAFKSDGGFKRFNMKFGGRLLEIIKQINTYIYEDRGVA